MSVIVHDDMPIDQRRLEKIYRMSMKKEDIGLNLLQKDI